MSRPRVPLTVATLGGRRRYWYVLPAAVLVGGLYLAMAYTGYWSLFEWDGFSLSPEFIGLGNFARMARDPAVAKLLQNSIAFGLVVIPATMGLGFVIALGLRSGVAASTVYSVVFFYPIILTPSVVAAGWRLFLNPDGMFNEALRHVGLGSLAHPWLSDPATALWALALAYIWAGTGFAFIFYYAALGQINREVFEAARIDGASAITVARRIAFPLLRRTHAALLLLGIIGVLKTLELPYLATRGGPARATEFATTYIVGVGTFGGEFGYASALSICLLAVALILAGLQIRFLRREA